MLVYQDVMQLSLPYFRRILRATMKKTSKNILFDDLPEALSALSRSSSVFMNLCAARWESGNVGSVTKYNRKSIKRWNVALSRCCAFGGAVILHYLEDWQDEDCEAVGGAAPGWTANHVLAKLNNENGHTDDRFPASNHISISSNILAEDDDLEDCIPLRHYQEEDEEDEEEEEDESLAPQSLLGSGWSLLDLTTGKEVDF